MAALPRPAVRRAISVPTVIVATVVTLLASLMMVPVLVLVDLLTPGSAWRTRTWCLVTGTLVNEVLGTTTALAMTVWHLGRNDRPTAQARYHRLEHWWAGLHARNFRRFAGVRWVVENPEEFTRGNAVVLGRHASHADAILPVILFGRVAGLHMRYTLKDSLQWAPAMDLVGNRLPNVFVDRTPGPDSPITGRLEALATGVDDQSVAVIFPEGTFYTADRLERAATRIAETAPELAASVRTLRHLLPPRPAGTSALLRGAPAADLVVVAHEGMEPFGGGSIADIARHLPLRHPVRVRLWRVARRDVPTDDDKLVAWLLDLWLEIDRWIDDCVDEREDSDGLPPSLRGLPELRL